MTPHQILTEAIALLQTKGWTQKAFGRNAAGDRLSSQRLASETDPPTCYCIVGALRAAFFNGTELQHRATTTGAWMPYDRAVALVNTALGLEDNPDSFRQSNLFTWNDQSARTKEEVIAALTKALELETVKA